MMELARHASMVFPQLPASIKNNALQALADALGKEEWCEKTLVSGIGQLAQMEDPVGQTLKAAALDDGLEVFCVSCPIGVIGACIEQDLNDAIEVISLCLKSSNTLLVSYPESRHGKQLMEIMDAISSSLPNGWLHIVHEDILGLPLDLVIPRGSAGFVSLIREKSSCPVLGAAPGVCHIYVDEDADLDMAATVCYDAKCNNPFARNAMETVIVHERIASAFLDKLKELLDLARIEFFGDDRTLKILSIEHADEHKWDIDHNGLQLSVKVVGGIDEAIQHINTFGSRTADAIMTTSKEKAKKFLHRVDSASVLWNCSTRFAQGYVYGLGVEATTSTMKIHARGPVGLEGMLSYKWKVLGQGQILADYTGKGEKKKFLQKHLEKSCPL